MSSPALAIFERLATQVGGLKGAAAREMAAGLQDSSAACLRSGIVLTVAAFDSYFHEQGVRLLIAHAAAGATQAEAVATYVGGLTAADVQGQHAGGLVRLRLSYKTLVVPDKIDELLKACGLDPDDLWLHASAAIGSRPDRVRRLVQLQVDRRNQIAHEGDWDPAAVDFRAVVDLHLDECMGALVPLVRELDSLMP